MHHCADFAFIQRHKVHTARQDLLRWGVGFREVCLTLERCEVCGTSSYQQCFDIIVSKLSNLSLNTTKHIESTFVVFPTTSDRWNMFFTLVRFTVFYLSQDDKFAVQSFAFCETYAALCVLCSATMWEFVLCEGYSGRVHLTDILQGN